MTKPFCDSLILPFSSKNIARARRKFFRSAYLLAALFMTACDGDARTGGVGSIPAGGEFLRLDPLGGTYIAARAISADGSIVVGSSYTANGDEHAFRWTNNVITDLGTLGGKDSEANAVSADGNVVAGWAWNASNDKHAFQWQDGTMTDLGTLGGQFSEAKFVSTDGSVVAGHSEIAKSAWHCRKEARKNAKNNTFLKRDGSLRCNNIARVHHAFRWKGGVMADLGTLGGQNSRADALSTNGNVVVGTSDTTSGDNHAFRWVDGTMTDLGTLGGKNSQTKSVSADGSVVVGLSETASGDNHAFRWKNGVMTDLGTLGGKKSSARFVSADGSVVVGQSAIASGDFHVFRWTGGVMTDLGTLGGKESAVEAISADGSVIIGECQIDNDLHAFHWTVTTGMQSVSDWLGANGATIPANITLTEAVAVSADGSATIGNYHDRKHTYYDFAWLARVSLANSGSVVDQPRSR